MENEEDIQLFRNLLRGLVASETSKVNAFRDDSFDQVSYAAKHVIATGKQSQFIEQLTQYINLKDADIERLSNTSYQEFVAGIDQLLKIRLGTSNMIKDIKDLRLKMQSSTNKVLEQKNDIYSQRKVLLNVEISLQVMQTCHFVLDIFNKVNTQIDQHRYYPALKLLQEIKTHHLDPIASYKLANEIENSFPKCEEKVRSAVVNSMKEWIVNVKESSQAIGKSALRNVMIKQERIATKLNQSTENSSANASVSLEIAMAEENDTELQDPIKKIDLKPLYQCILIHEFLGEKEILKIDFEKSRKHHAELLLNLQVSIASNGNLKYVEDFIQEVVGYFMIESIVMSSTESFRSRGVVESIWESIMDKMNEIIASTLKTTSDTKVFLGLKNLIVNFMQSIEMYGYSVIKLSDSMSNLYDSFTELMKSECTEKITQAVEDDSLVPLIVNNQEEYLALCLHFKFTDDKKIIGTRYPKTLSCTNGFIVCCQLIKKFIFEFYKFAEGFKQQNNEMDDLLKKSVDNLLTQAVNSGLMQRISDSGISDIVQIIINIEYFNGACSEIEQLLSENKNCHKGSTVNLQARDIFKISIKKGEKTIQSLINESIQQKLTSTPFNWTNTLVNMETIELFSATIDEYMRTKVSSVISQLTLDFRIHVYSGALDQVAKTAKDLLIGPTIRKLTNQSVESFDRGLNHLEQCLRDQCPDITTPESLLELRQLMEYIKADVYEDYLIPNIKNKKYAMVRYQDVIEVLEKIKFDIGMFSKAADKSKRKIIETVIKSLKGM